MMRMVKAAALAALVAGVPVACPAAAQPVLSAPAFQQVAVTTRDLGRAIAFYRDRLGLPLMFETNGMAFFDVGGVRLMIATDAARTDTRPVGILYFNAPDFSDALMRLTASGAELVGPVEVVQKTPAGELRLQQFEDPDGNMLAIMGTVSASAAP